MIIVARFGIHLEKVLVKDYKNCRIERQNLKHEHGHSVLAHNSLGWEFLEKRIVEMKARIMYKTVNKLAPSKLCNLFQNVNKINDYNLRLLYKSLYPNAKNRIPKTKFLL